jgi:glycosyltransferase involved in cell wall biosynthesis
MKPSITIVAAVNNRKVLQQNLMSSPALTVDDTVEVLIKEGFASASLAYNHAIDEARGEIIVFVHQDVYLPRGWISQLRSAICYLEGRGQAWGVLGCFGSRFDAHGGLGQVFTTGMGLHGNKIREPQSVETLDEIVLVIRKSSGLRFDPALPHFHMYGTDICMIARERGLPSYAMPAFCVHNTNQLLELPPEYYACYRYVKRKWTKYVPIASACVSITRFNGELLKKRVLEFAARARSRGRTQSKRIDDPTALLSAELWRKLGAPGLVSAEDFEQGAA